MIHFFVFCLHENCFTRKQVLSLSAKSLFFILIINVITSLMGYLIYVKVISAFICKSQVLECGN